MGVVATSAVPFLGTLLRRDKASPPSSRYCLRSTASLSSSSSPTTWLAWGATVEARVGRRVLQGGGVGLHAANALLVYLIATKFLEDRRVENRHVRAYCSFLATAVLFGPHSLRAAMLGDVTGATLVFLAATTVTLGGVYLRVTDGVRGRVHPSAVSSVALLAGTLLVASVLLSAAAPQLPWLSGAASVTSSDTPAYGDGYLSSALSPAGTTAAAAAAATTTTTTPAPPILSMGWLLAVPSAVLVYVMATVAAAHGRIRAVWASIRVAESLWLLTGGLLKVLQSALNVAKAQVFLPVNVDKGYVQLQSDALFLGLFLFDTKKWWAFAAAPGRYILSGVRTFNVSSVISVVVNAPGHIVGMMPLFELMATLGLLLYVGGTVVRQLLYRRKAWPFGARSTVAANAAIVTALSCSAIGLAPNDNDSRSARGANETTLLSLQSYVPSAFMSVCLGEGCCSLLLHLFQ